MNEILKIDSLCKKFILRTRKATLKESLIHRFRGSEEKRVIWALRDVTFNLEHGQALGIVGHNGAGKSTLLRLMCGVGRPTSGTIDRVGQFSGLLELGAGFQPLMSGRENLQIAGILNGLSPRQVRDLEHDIIQFAELEEFIDQPVRSYSSGMYLRLAFSVAIHFDPDALVIDEILTVGDVRFRQKCMQRIEDFRRSGKTLIVASHDPAQIQNLCDEILVMEEGRVVMIAAPEKAFACYHDLMRRRTQKRASELPNSNSLAAVPQDRGIRTGTQEATIDNVHIRGNDGSLTESLQSGDSMTIELHWSIHRPLTDVSLTLAIYSDTDTKCFETVISSISETFGSLQQIKRIRCHVPHVPLLPGSYHVAAGLYPVNHEFTYDYHWKMHPFAVLDSGGNSFYTYGVVALKPKWTLD